MKMTNLAKQIITTNNNNNHENLNIVITTDKLSFTMTLSDYQEVMYPNAEDAGYVAVATKKDTWKQRMYKATEWFEYIEVDTNCYASVNTFFMPKRQIRAVRHLNAFFVDLDIYNAGVSKNDVINAIDFLVKTERILRPTFIISSGRGMYLIWKIEDVPGIYKKTKGLYNAIQNYLVEQFDSLGADNGAKDIARVLRVPGTVNTKNSEKVEVLDFNDKGFYTMSMFAEFVDDFEELQQKNKQPKTIKEQPKTKSKKKETKQSKIAHLFNSYTLNKTRANDIKSLCKLRGYDLKGQRDTFIYIYHYYMLQIHRDEKVALYYTLNLNDLFIEPLTEKEVKSYVKSSVNAFKEHLKDKTKGYNFKNDTLIDKLQITKEEQATLKTIISVREKYDRNNVRRTPRNEQGLTAREANKQALIQQVKELYEQGLTSLEIANKLGKTKRYINQIIKNVGKN